MVCTKSGWVSTGERNEKLFMYLIEVLEDEDQGRKKEHSTDTGSVRKCEDEITEPTVESKQIGRKYVSVTRSTCTRKNLSMGKTWGAYRWKAASATAATEVMALRAISWTLRGRGREVEYLDANFIRLSVH